MIKINADNKERIETGGLQINDDWPGLFIRGDNALYLSMLISMGINEVYDIQLKMHLLSIKKLIDAEIMVKP